MKPTAIALPIAVLLCACDQAKHLSGLSEIDSRMGALEVQVTGLQSKVSNTGQWVLWRRFVPHGQLGYTPAQAASAFGTKSECTDAVAADIVPGGTKVTNEPVEIVYQNGTQYFYCLPYGVTAGIQK